MVNKLLSKLTIAAGLSLPLVALAASSVFAQIVKVSVVNNSGKTMTGSSHNHRLLPLSTPESRLL
ncbi:hypothetical protein [Microcoleus sp.]|uniref:hypothetical protein n=1 Tax=Microcoleus sp. TaxID=44472 RepID=UPI0035231DBE